VAHPDQVGQVDLVGLQVLQVQLAQPEPRGPLGLQVRVGLQGRLGQAGQQAVLGLQVVLGQVVHPVLVGPQVLQEAQEQLVLQVQLGLVALRAPRVLQGQPEQREVPGQRDLLDHQDLRGLPGLLVVRGLLAHLDLAVLVAQVGLLVLQEAQE